MILNTILFFASAAFPLPSETFLSKVLKASKPVFKEGSNKLKDIKIETIFSVEVVASSEKTDLMLCKLEIANAA